MTKKFFIIGLTALLGVSLFLTGCPTDADDTDGLSEAEKATNELANTGVLNGKATASGTTVTLKEGVDLEDAEPFVIPAGVTLAVPDGIILSVDSTAELTVTGALTVEGTLTIPQSGEIVVESGGEYVLEDGADGTNEGTITIESGGSTWGKGGDITGNGVNVVEKGGKAYLHGTTATDRDYVVGDAPVTAGENAVNAAPIILLTTAETKITFNNAGFRLDGEATLNGIEVAEQPNDKLFFLLTPQILTIGVSSTLTIPNSPLNETGFTILLTPVEESGPPVLLGESGAKIILQPRGFIAFTEDDGNFTADFSSKSWNNFYSGTSTKETGAYGTLLNNTYNWNANAGGTDVAG
ncbi:MAG: hypothetical protein LBT00_04940 [Spirochaetaceae bacterium]|jgi:hypothetical protein|nr:hypothetical protein [Spirochaetaceae bacterium]